MWYYSDVKGFFDFRDFFTNREFYFELGKNYTWGLGEISKHFNDSILVTIQLNG